jgi:hypothetical protein
MWLLLQGLIMFGVFRTNIVWHWTPNNYLVAILAWIAALLVTVGMNGLLGDLLRRRATGERRGLRASAV